MKVLRTTMWSPGYEMGPTIVMSEHDLKVSVEEAAQPTPGIFTTSEIIEMEDDLSPVETTFRAMESLRETADRERNMAVLYYYTIAQFRMLAPRGSIIPRGPAPLSPDQIRSVFEQIAIHPDYRDFICTAIAEDGATMVVLREGKVLTGDNGVPHD